MTVLKRGTIVIHGTARQTTTRGMGCVCSGPAYGTPYCVCELAYVQAQPVDDDEFDEDDE